MYNNTDYLFELDSLYSFFNKDNKKEIFNNFCNELLIRGWNVCNAAETYEVTPHIMNKQMVELYTKSDAFIYECTVAGLEPEKIKKDNFIINYIKHKISSNQLDILCYGDGIGLDSQIHSANGHNVTYYDVEGLSFKYAKYRLGKLGLVDKIKFVTNEKKIANNHYDIVICREVLEHLENPINTMKKLWGYINKEGICFLSESFSRVENRFPTHLAKNLQHADKTIELMVDKGFWFIDRFNDTNLMVFKKVNSNNQDRFKSIPSERWMRKIKKNIREKINYYLS